MSLASKLSMKLVQRAIKKRANARIRLRQANSARADERERKKASGDCYSAHIELGQARAKRSGSHAFPTVVSKLRMKSASREARLTVERLRLLKLGQPIPKKVQLELDSLRAKRLAAAKGKNAKK